MAIVIVLAIIYFVAGAIEDSAKRRKPESTIRATGKAQAERDRQKQLAAYQKAQAARERAEAAAERQAARDAEKARKKEEATAQARQDYSFYSARLETLLAMETDTARSYYRAVETVEHDAQQNKYSYVIGEKTVQKHIAERDRLQIKLLKIQTQIHGVEKQIAKAKGILAS